MSNLSADEFNKLCPEGTRVKYHPIIGHEEGSVETKTRSEAWELGDGTPVVMIEGKSGGVALKAIDIL